MKDKIFIQIPAYRDTELQPTLHDLIKNSSDPKQLRIVVVWQYDRSEEQNERSLRQWPNVELIKVPAEKSLGCNWARNLLQQQWRGEKYTLFLDSHHRFIPGWDAKVIDMYRKLKLKDISKPLITTYLPTYDPGKDPENRMRNILKIRFLKRKKGLIFRLVGKEIPYSKLPEEPIPAHFASLHFLFTEGLFNKEIEFDPSIYFFADEIAIALRAFTFGYNLFHPNILLGWHLYDRSSRVPHWIDHPEWKTQNENSCRQLFRLYQGEIAGRHGIGLQRSVSDYENYIGMKLIQNKLNKSMRPNRW